MMDRNRALEIQKHLLDAAGAMGRAEATIFDLGEEARRTFAEPLGTVACALHFDLLRIIYDRFPDLEPPPNQVPTVTSTLRWDQVRLPPSVSEADVDAVVIAAMTPRFRKMATVVGNALKRCKELSAAHR